MSKDNLEIIIENILDENATNDMFRTNIDPVNVYVTGYKNWDKYKNTFGDKEFDDAQTENFKVIWGADFEYKRDGIYGLIVNIESVYGTFDFLMYDNHLDTGTLEFGKEDFDKMILVSEPKMSKHNQLIVNGIEINFDSNTITIEYH